MQLLVSGIPGTGKSTFSRWLVSEHDYVRSPQDDEPGDRFFDDVIRALDSSSDVVIDWGLPASDPAFRPCIEFVRGLVSRRHVEQWWLDGDRDAALQSYLGRGGGRSAWDWQIAGVDRHWDEICEVFAGRTIDVISAGPNYVPNEERFELMRRAARGTR